MIIFIIIVALVSELQRELFENRSSFPDSHDLTGIISAILRIQGVYNIRARAIADGKLSQEKERVELGADECYEVGIVSNRLEYYVAVIDWMKEALKRMSKPYNYSGSVTRSDVLEYLSWAEYQVNLRTQVERVYIPRRQVSNRFLLHGKCARTIYIHEYAPQQVNKFRTQHFSMMLFVYLIGAWGFIE